MLTNRGSAEVRIGTAGWSIPASEAESFPADGSALERYADRFSCVEINSSFYRPHRPDTWERWHDAVPDSFSFSVKMPKAISHERKLIACEDLADEFITQTRSLRAKLGVLLLQLPPKLEFEPRVAERFLRALTERSPAAIACEPRNATWMTSSADELLNELGIARVAADPPVTELGGVPGGWKGLKYWRLHGSPVLYRSSYEDRIAQIAEPLSYREDDSVRWCIFDNTASSAAARDALALQRAVT